MANPHYIRDDDHDDEDESTPPLRSVHSGDLGPLPEVWVRPASDEPTTALPLERLTRPLGDDDRLVLGGIRPISSTTGSTTGSKISDGPRATGVPPSEATGWQDTYRPFAERRMYDEHRTGRSWPTAVPRTDEERGLMQNLCLAPGDVHPPLLARVNARRYVTASQSRSVYGGDRLAKTDIYSIAYFGLGLDLHAVPFREQTLQRHVLAIYDRNALDIGLDDAIFSPPAPPRGWAADGRNVIEPYVWRDAIDASWAARFLLAWCCGVHLTSILALPLTLGFVPVTPAQGSEYRAHPDVLNRYALAMQAACELLAPRERLARQVAFVLQESHGYRDGTMLNGEQIAACAGPRWREALRYYFPAERDRLRRDPVTRMLAALAAHNGCPQFVCERSLDDHAGIPAPQMWGAQLIRDLYYWLANPDPQRPNRYQQALQTYESTFGYQQRFGREPLQLTLAL